MRDPAAQRNSPSAERPLVVISGRGDASDTTTGGGGVGVHDTSGIEVRIGARGARRARRPDGGSGRGGSGRTRMLVVAAAVLAVVAVAGIWVGWLAGSGGGGGNAGNGAKAPRTGPAIEVSTTDGYRYRMAAAEYGVDPAAAQSQASPGADYAYAEYVLTNPSDVPVLLDLYAVDVFLKRGLIPQSAQGRCMWQNGVPEDMCTPPTRSQITRQLEGGPPTDGANGGKYMPPGASYLIRVTVDVPVSAAPQAGQLRLYVWKQLYIADALAKEIPFPRS